MLVVGLAYFEFYRRTRILFTAAIDAIPRLKVYRAHGERDAYYTIRSEIQHNDIDKGALPAAPH